MQRAIKKSCSVGGAGGRGNQEAVWSIQASIHNFWGTFLPGGMETNLDHSPLTGSGTLDKSSQMEMD